MTLSDVRQRLAGSTLTLRGVLLPCMAGGSACASHSAAPHADAVSPVIESGTLTVPGVPTLRDVVTVVPLRVVYGFIQIPAELDGHRGTFILDTGSGNSWLERDSLIVSSSTQTPAALSKGDAATYGNGTAGMSDTTLHTLRIGTLVQTLGPADLGPPVPQPSNVDILHDDNAQHKTLGGIGLNGIAAFEAIIDYLHQRLVLIRLDSAGHRLAAVPAYTPVGSVPLVPSHLHVAPMLAAQWWGVEALRGTVLDTLIVDTGSPMSDIDTLNQQHAADQVRSALLMAGPRGVADRAIALPAGDQLPGNLLGYPFMRRLGVVGFNLRTHEFLLYRMKGRPQATSDSEPLIAEAVLRRKPNDRGNFYYLPATIQRHRVSLILDTGAEGNFLLDPKALASAGIQPSTDSDGSTLIQIAIGASAESPVNIEMRDDFGGAAWTPSGLPPTVGLIGAGWLAAHYDLMFDGPARRVRLYRRPPPPSDTAAVPGPRQTWLPPGLTPADCMPMRRERDVNNPYDDNDQFVHLWLGVNGHLVPGIFDSGSDYVVVNVAAATQGGITKHTQHLRRLPDDSIDRYANGVLRAFEYEVPAGVTLTLGARSLTATPLRILSRLNPSKEQLQALFAHTPVPSTVPRDSIPTAIIGKEVVRDQLLLISYSTQHVCLSAPVTSGNVGQRRVSAIRQ